MSKLSQLHMELEEQASELGFEGLGEAEQAGYGVDWENGKLIKVEDEQEKAHEAWLKERNRAIEVLDLVADVLSEINDGLLKAGDEELVEAWSLMELSRETRDVGKFIKEQCHD